MNTSTRPYSVAKYKWLVGWNERNKQSVTLQQMRSMQKEAGSSPCLFYQLISNLLFIIFGCGFAEKNCENWFEELTNFCDNSIDSHSNTPPCLLSSVYYHVINEMSIVNSKFIHIFLNCFRHGITHRFFCLTPLYIIHSLYIFWGAV